MNWLDHNYFFVDIAFYNYFVTMYKGPMISSVVESSWNWNFADFRDLGLILLEAATRGVLKNFAIFRGKHLYQSLFFIKVAGLRYATLLKRDSVTWILQNFYGHLFNRTPLASISQRLLALYIAAIHSWQLSSNGKSLVRKKTHPRILQISLTHIFSFSLTNVCLPCWYAKRMLYS